MDNFNFENCFFCGGRVKPFKEENGYYFVECPCCGRYNISEKMLDETKGIKNEVASYLYYTGNKAFRKEPDHYYAFIGEKEDYEREHNKYSWAKFVTKEEILAFYPKTFSEKITRMLIGFSKRSRFIGDGFSLSFEENAAAMFLKKWEDNGEPIPNGWIADQQREIDKYLNTNDLACLNGRYGIGSVKCKILPNGWTRIDKEENKSSNSKNVFVSMAFNGGTKKTREAIREGIVKAGYLPEFIDEIIHNQQIVPEMFKLIRECRFLILDISDPNYGAYYEAGYALGLGKEVIICCKKDVFSKDYTDEEEAKHIKPHFDIAQKQILVWNNYEDLTNRLTEWIKALI